MALVVLLVGALVAVGGIASPAPASAAPALPPGFVFQDSPSGQGAYDLTDFDYLPDGSVLSTGKTGQVSWVSTAGQARTIATIPVTTVQDLGLGGLAVAPDFDASHIVYTAYEVQIPAGREQRLSRWTVRLDGAGNPVGLAGEAIIVRQLQTSDVHGMTGVIAAPDGTVWVSSGDGSDFRFQDDLAFRAQDPRSGQVLGDECYLLRHNVLLGPNADLARVPWWGRVGESVGEDPVLAIEMTKGVPAAVQRPGVMVTYKHPLGYNQETNRGGGQNTIVDERTLREVYARPVRRRDPRWGGVAHVVVQPAQRRLRLRERLDAEQAAARRVRLRRLHHVRLPRQPLHVAGQRPRHGDAGLPDPADLLRRHLVWAVQTGSISEAVIDRACTRILWAMFATGLFDTPLPDTDQPIPYAEHATVAREIEEAAITLLKNDGGDPASGPRADPIDRRHRRRHRPRHLRRPVPARFADKWGEPARPAQHPRACRALHRPRAAPPRRDRIVDRALPHVAALPRQRHDAVAAHRRLGHDDRDGTDIGAGDEWLIPRVLNDCSKVHMSELGDRSTAIDPAQLLFLGTLAGARALDQEQLFGNLDAGKDADFVIVDPATQPGFDLSLRPPADGGARSHLFTLLMGMREASITDVFVRGRRVVAPEPAFG